MKTITLFTLSTGPDVHYLLALGSQLHQQGLEVCLAAASAFQGLANKLGLYFQPVTTASSPGGEEEGRELLLKVQELAQHSSLLVIHKPYLSTVRALGPLPCPIMGIALKAEEVFARFARKGSLLRRFSSWVRRNSNQLQGMYIPTLYNFSPRLLCGDEEHHPPIHLCGQWSIPDSLQRIFLGRSPSPALSDWLYRGGRPVFFDFSQTPEAEREFLLKMVKELSKMMGFRAILCTNWPGFEEGILQRDIFHVQSPIQEWLFQQCAVVIHYRQTANLPAAARAGVPSILCGSGTEATCWGQLLQHHGIGIHLRKEPPTATALKAALEEALRLSMQYKAKSMGKTLREEQGLEYAVETICRQVSAIEKIAVAV